MVVQLIQKLVWILLSGESMDPLKPFEWIWMVVQLTTNTVQMVSPRVYKTNGHFLKVEILIGFKWSISRRDILFIQGEQNTHTSNLQLLISVGLGYMYYNLNFIIYNIIKSIFVRTPFVSNSEKCMVHWWLNKMVSLIRVHTHATALILSVLLQHIQQIN